MKTVLVTGVAGFIGYHVMKTLSRLDLLVVGVDSINDYYDQSLKVDRLKNLGFESVEEWNSVCKSKKANNILFYRMNIADATSVGELFDNYEIDAVINLAAQAGVRYSLTHPEKYIQANIQGVF